MDKDEELKKFAEKLQEQILEQIRKGYPETVIEHWQRPRNFLKMDHPDGHAQVKGTCGDTMEMLLRMKHESIAECSFQTDGCGTTIACGSVATDLAKGKTFTQALASVTADHILKRLGGLPEEDVHCAQLSSEAFRLALADCLTQKRAPWKKSYRKL